VEKLRWSSRPQKENPTPREEELKMNSQFGIAATQWELFIVRVRVEQLLKTTDARLTCDEVVKESSQKAEANLIKKWNTAIE
jgi:hypothetical protein